MGGECEECRNKRGTPQRKASTQSEIAEAPRIVRDISNSPGQPLDVDTRAFFESRFGRDFSGVRVHAGAAAAESARQVNALAYTIGQDIVFASGRYAPTTQNGKKLLAHELTHVAQQSAMGGLGIQCAAGEEEKTKAANKASQKPDAEAGVKPTVTPAQAEAASAPAASDAEIDALDLAVTAKAGAQELKKKHSEIKFTSGRRNVAEQAHAMASNIVSSKDRKWIEKTYASAASLQKWVDDNPKVETVDDIAKGLEGEINALSEQEKGWISKHLSGEAFDVQPQEKDAEAIKKDIKALTGLSKFLEKEGGLVRWHAQFKPADGAVHGYDQYEEEADRAAELVVRSDIPAALPASRAV